MDTERRMGERAALVLLLGVAACPRQPAAPPAAAPSPAAPAAPCPIVPVALVVTPAGSEPRAVLSLDAKGSLDVSLFAEKRGAATLDEQGCLVGRGQGNDELWAEWAPHDKLWTPHQTLDVAGSCLAMSSSRSLCIAADGKIEVRAKDEPPGPGTMVIRGYREEARCAGLLLLATFTAMMPSMAVVDGKPARAPAPEGSRCGAHRRP